MLNEIELNPPGGDDNRYEYVELRGVPGTSLNNVCMAVFDGAASGNPGFADLVVNLTGSSLGSNGLLMIKSPFGSGHSPGAGTTVVTTTFFTQSGGFSQGTLSFYLFSSSTALVAGTDYDTNNDGTLDHLPSGAVSLDNVGVRNTDSSGTGDKVYGGIALTESNTGTPDAATRFNNNDATVAGAWYDGELYDVGNVASQLTYDQTRKSANMPANAVLTPGNVNFPNFPPTLTGPSSASVQHGDSFAFSGGNLIGVSDSDGGPSESVTLTVNSGSLTASTSGGGSQSGTATNLILSGTIAQLNAALATLSYAAPSTGASDTLTVQASDGLASSTPLGVAITLNNVAPTVAPSGFSPTYYAGGTAVAVDSGVTVSDGNSSPALGATVSITGNLQSGDVLNFNNQNGISGSYNNGVLTLSGGGSSLANYQAALQSVKFTSASNSTATRTVSFVVTDGALSSTPTTTTVNVPGLNGDLNGDGFVGASDMSIILGDWGQYVTPGNRALGDVDGDGFVGASDLSAVLAQWGQSAVPSGANVEVAFSSQLSAPSTGPPAPAATTNAVAATSAPAAATPPTASPQPENASATNPPRSRQPKPVDWLARTPMGPHR